MRPSRLPTLQFRFAWKAAVLSLVVIWLIGAASAWYWPGQLQRAVHDGVASHLRALDAELNLVGLSPDFARPLVLPAPEQLVQVVSEDGRVIAASSELVGAERLMPETSAETGDGGEAFLTIPDPRREGEEVLVMARPIVVGQSRYLGVVGGSLSRVDGARTAILWISALGGMGLAIVVGVLVWTSVRLALRPVNALAGEALELGSGSGPWQLTVTPETAELQRLAGSLNDLLFKIRDTFARERRFLDDASHELRTPIAVARGELDLATGAAELAEMSSAVRSAIDELDRLDRIAADLLVLARASGKDRLNFTEIDMGGLVRREINTLVRRPDHPPVRIEVDGDGLVLGDVHALARAVGNIVINGVAHCETSVQVIVETVRDVVNVRVSDDGPGFPPELLDSALERFTRTRNGSVPGTGLGLAIAAEIAGAHGGGVEVEDNPAGGAVVTLWLPAATAVAPASDDATRG